MEKNYLLDKWVKILFLFFLVFAGLHFAKPFLAPFAIAAVLSMLFLPLTRKLEKKGISRGLSNLTCILLLLLAIAAIAALLSTQIARFSEDFPKIKQNISQSLEKLKQYVTNTVGVSTEKQQQVLDQQQSSGSGSSGKVVTGIMNALGSFMVDTILVFVYIFLLLYFRTHLKKAVLKIVSEENKETASKILEQTSTVAGKYLTGLGSMIVMLWIMYGIGFSIVGVKNAIFFAILCGLLEIIPFVGNITGTGLTVIMGLSQGGGGGIVIGIIITYLVVQFVQTYILEPLVVGSEVSINPLFTIIAIVAGELVWGIAGMVLAIPALGIVKVVCDNIEPLKPYGFLIGEEKKKGGKNILDKVKGWFK